ncbi:MAG TPA: MBL fold metallo-hydrolase [Allosphingosinicella sp.]|nr:MBL fold metallo-hydrolase [Allosphingosinicella sp.]
MTRAVAALLLLAAEPAIAQSAPPPAAVTVERVAPGVAVLFGRGGNVGLSYGADGNVLIDDQYAPMTEPILAAVRAIDPDPVRFVVNTHWHGDHTGGNENLGRGGTIVVAHDNVRRRMSMEQLVRTQIVPPSPAGALPVVTFSESVTFHLNGDDIRVIHVAEAHTDGDALIFWTRANVLHMGDVYFRGMLPFIDLDSGGSIDGMIAAMSRALDLANERTVIIPGHGPVASRADLERDRDTLIALRNRIGQGIAMGRTLEQLIAEGHADGHGRDSDFISPAAFTEAVYRSLRRDVGRLPD